MADPNIQQQIFEHINRANRILIPLGTAPSGDSTAAALALQSFLKKLDKEARIVAPAGVPDKFKFLPGADGIQDHLEDSRGFVISVRTENAPLEELSYHQDEDKQVLNIYLKAKDGKYEPDDVRFSSDRFPYDLIIIPDIPSLDMLGKLYDENTDLFFETPIVNIDHHANNEHFGEINMVDITATSTTEILMDLLENFEAGLIDSDISTNLLTGILVETNSFQHIKTTPKAFLKASNLISMGSNQQEIVKQLYKTKSVALLKLWGRALARIKEVPELGLSYMKLSAEDMEKSGSREIMGVMEELTASLTEAKVIVLLAETKPEEVQGFYQIHPNLPALDFATRFSADMINGHMGKFVISGKSLADAEKEVLDRVKKLNDKMKAK